MLGFLEIIFSVIGICGAINGSSTAMLVGLIAILVMDFIDVFVTGHNPLTIYIAILMAIGSAFYTKNILYSFTWFLCGENLLMTGLTLLLLIYGIIVSVLNKGKTSKEENTKIEIKDEITIDIKRYEELLEVIKKGSGVDTLDEAIKVFFEFYLKNNKNIPLELVCIENLTTIQKYQNLLKILEIGIGIKGIDNIQNKLYYFYTRKGIEIPLEYLHVKINDLM